MNAVKQKYTRKLGEDMNYHFTYFNPSRKIAVSGVATYLGKCDVDGKNKGDAILFANDKLLYAKTEFLTIVGKTNQKPYLIYTK